MSVWLVRAGRHGEREDLALEKGMAVIGWEDLPDLSQARSKDEVFKLCKKVYTEKSDGTLHNWAAQVSKFVGQIQEGDIVVLPLKTQSAIALGKVAGDYEYHTELGELVRHIRPVKWVRKDVPRTAFKQDLLYSLGAAMTVCTIERNDAENRIRAVMKGAIDPGYPGDGGEDEGDEEPVNVELVARDQLLKSIEANFKGHDLARLVNAILRAEGYQTRLSPPGPDRGVDILAGTGALGFDAPRICVQVKSQTSPVDAAVVRELQGVMQSFKADHGLLVSWGGFTGAAVRESRDKYFSVRLWDSGDVLNALFKNYHSMSETIRAELPMKSIWTLVLEEE